MSRIALTPNASGTGTLTIAAPNTDTDRTLTLPDATGTVNISGLANQVPAGSAGAPAIYPTGDSNTGIFFPAADTIAFSEGGAEAMRIASSGYVGIGTTSPNYMLHVNGAFGASMMQFTYSTSGSGVSDGLRIGTGTSGTFINEGEALPITFSTNNTQCFALAASGAVGVGPALNYGTSGHLLTSGGSGAAGGHLQRARGGEGI